MRRAFANHRLRWSIMVVVAVLVIGGSTMGGIAAFGNRAKPIASCKLIIPNDTPQAGRVVITESDNGQSVDVRTGDQVLLNVKVTPSTGNTWSVKEISNPAVLSQGKISYNLDDV